MLGTDGVFAAVLAFIGVRQKPRPVNVAAISDKPTAEVIAMPLATPATQEPPKGPRDASVLAYIEHAIDYGVQGPREFSLLWELYGETCACFGLKPLSIQWFRLELNAIGLVKGQLDLRRNGRRHRPTYFVIPSRDEFASRQMIKARLAGRALCA